MAKESWEDEEDVADSWDAEEDDDAEAEVQVKPSIAKQPEAKPNKAATAAAVVEPPVNETAQERKERLERAMKESDLANAMELFGISKEEVDVEAVLEVPKKKGK